MVEHSRHALPAGHVGPSDPPNSGMVGRKLLSPRVPPLPGIPSIGGTGCGSRARAPPKTTSIYVRVRPARLKDAFESLTYEGGGTVNGYALEERPL